MTEEEQKNNKCMYCGKETTFKDGWCGLGWFHMKCYEARNYGIKNIKVSPISFWKFWKKSFWDNN